MNSPSDSSVSYLCPHCQMRLLARPEDGGQRRQCPHCGKPVKVPGGSATRDGTPSSAAAPTGGQLPEDPPTGHVVGQGIASVAIRCPVCGTRLYATSAQVGATLICPDCLESVKVESRAPVPSAAPPPPAAAGPQPPRQVLDSPDKPNPAADENDEDDEFRLSEPEDVARPSYLPADLLRMVQDHDPPPPPGGRAEPPAAGPSRPAETAPPAASALRPAPPPPPPAPDEFTVQCGVCDTRIQATAAEIGQSRRCPDCFSLVCIQRPAPRPQRRPPHPAATPDRPDPSDDEETFRLSEPVERTVMRDAAEKATRVPTLGDQALHDAEQEYARRRREEPSLPRHPLWTGLFRIFWDLGMLVRWGTISLICTVVGTLTLWTLTRDQEGGKSLFFAAAATVGSMVVSIIGGAFTSVSCLAVLQESANGGDQVREWPDVNFIEWLGECLFVVVALFYSLTPGIILASGLSCLGLPPLLTSLIAGASLFVLYPITQLSMLEDGSLASPLTTPILQSIWNEPRLWLTFYGAVGAVLLVVGVGGMFITADSSWIVLVMSIIWSGCLLLYFRLLGRLAWACRERPVQEDPENDELP